MHHWTLDKESYEKYKQLLQPKATLLLQMIQERNADRKLMIMLICNVCVLQLNALSMPRLFLTLQQRIVELLNCKLDTAYLNTENKNCIYFSLLSQNESQ